MPTKGAPPSNDAQGRRLGFVVGVPAAVIALLTLVGWGLRGSGIMGTSPPSGADGSYVTRREQFDWEHEHEAGVHRGAASTRDVRDVQDKVQSVEARELAAAQRLAELTDAIRRLDERVAVIEKGRDAKLDEILTLLKLSRR